MNRVHSALYTLHNALHRVYNVLYRAYNALYRDDLSCLEFIGPCIELCLA